MGIRLVEEWDKGVGEGRTFLKGKGRERGGRGGSRRWSVERGEGRGKGERKVSSWWREAGMCKMLPCMITSNASKKVSTSVEVQMHGGRLKAMR